jgi:hypothetical protein
MATPEGLHHLHNRSEEIPGETKTCISRQYSPGNFQSDPSGKISIAIAILLEKLIRINQTQIENFRQTLIEKWCTCAIARRESDLSNSAQVLNF